MLRAEVDYVDLMLVCNPVGVQIVAVGGTVQGARSAPEMHFLVRLGGCFVFGMMLPVQRCLA